MPRDDAPRGADACAKLTPRVDLPEARETDEFAGVRSVDRIQSLTRKER